MNRSKKVPSRRTLGVLVAVAALLVALAVPFQASADVVVGADCGPTVDQYNPPTNPIDCEEIITGGGGGTLPFTGIDIVPLAAIALGLAGAGLLIRRYGRESEQL